jgi:hypothetical protein
MRWGNFSINHLVTHGDYLTDQDWFWAGIVSNATAPNVPTREIGAIDVIVAGLAMERRATIESPLIDNVIGSADLTIESDVDLHGTRRKLIDHVPYPVPRERPAPRLAWDSGSAKDIDQFVTRDIFVPADDKHEVT